ncbi:hypothetical protein HYX19_02620, partial [Candidatus Woesearchaeota archaeon]|nr:hypothetical protein [Candidatus Woesearchaeota archaeon]
MLVKYYLNFIIFILFLNLTYAQPVFTTNVYNATVGYSPVFEATSTEPREIVFYGKNITSESFSEIGRCSAPTKICQFTLPTILPGSLADTEWNYYVSYIDSNRLTTNTTVKRILVGSSNVLTNEPCTIDINCQSGLIRNIGCSGPFSVRSLTGKCISNQCRYIIKDAQCISYQQNSCVNSNTLRIYSLGTCSSDSYLCNYGYQDLNCPQGCPNDPTCNSKLNDHPIPQERESLGGTASTGGSRNTLATIPIGRCSSLGFGECDKLTGLYIYNYSNQGPLGSEFTLTIPSDSGGFSEAPLSDRLISCNNLSDITLAYYNFTNRTWVPITAALLNNRLVIRVNFLGTFAIVKKPSCVPKECGPYGYYLIPPDGFVPVNNPLKFVVCGFLPGCQPAEPGCSRACPQGIDPQCPTCTKASGNCCVPKLDNECDLDCAPGVDPDCAQAFTPGEINCDDDGTCNPGCPNSTTFKVTTTGLLNRNFMWYADVDCCRQYGSSITSNTGDCCRAVCDGICDGDCIIGQDPDCTYQCPYCGDGKLNDVQYPERVNAVNPNGYKYESCIECSQDCPGGANQFKYIFTEGDGGNAPTGAEPGFGAESGLGTGSGIGAAPSPGDSPAG